jgi:hypothetical protein
MFHGGSEAALQETSSVFQSPITNHQSPFSALSPFAAWRLSDYAYQEWDYAFEDVLEFAWTIRRRDVPVADAPDASWRRS